jgi:hypothetical protein
MRTVIGLIKVAPYLLPILPFYWMHTLSEKAASWAWVKRFGDHVERIGYEYDI